MLINRGQSKPLFKRGLLIGRLGLTSGQRSYLQACSLLFYFSARHQKAGVMLLNLTPKGHGPGNDLDRCTGTHAQGERGLMAHEARDAVAGLYYELEGVAAGAG